MDIGEKTGLKGRELIGRLIGIKTPVGGIDWEPPPEERERATRVLAYLVEQRALCDPYDTAIREFVAQDIADLRGRLQCEIEALQTSSILQEGLRAMHAACRVFLEENQSPRSGYGPPYEAQLHSTLGELRSPVWNPRRPDCLRIRLGGGCTFEEYIASRARTRRPVGAADHQ